jgi:hypothetical protein
MFLSDIGKSVKNGGRNGHLFEGVRRKPKRNRGPEKARSIAEITTLLMAQEKNWIHSMLCRLSRQKDLDCPSFRSLE